MTGGCRGAALLALLGLAGARPVLAVEPPAPAACAEGPRPWIEIAVAAGAWDAATVGEVVRHMRAELAAQRIDVCERAPASSGRPPIAMVAITPEAGNAVDLAIDVRDAVTRKRVGRNVDLTSIPADGRALTIALAADELLRASWAELALGRAPSPGAGVEVADAVTASVRGALTEPPHFPRARLSLGPAIALFAGGQRHFGAALEGGVELGPRLAASLSAGTFWARPTSAPDGAIQGFVLEGAAALAWTVTQPGARAGVDLGARLALDRVTFVPAPASGATGATGSGVAVVAAAGPAAWVALRPTLRAFVAARAGIPLRSIKAWDRDQVVSSVSGFALLAQAGIASSF
jgi:hypothetical protein